MAFTPCGNDRVSLYTSLGNVHHTVSVFCQDADVAAAAIILKTFNFVGNDEHFRAFERTFQSHYFSFRKYLYTIFRRFRISLWSVGLSIARYWQPTTEMWGAFIWAAVAAGALRQKWDCIIGIDLCLQFAFAYCQLRHRACYKLKIIIINDKLYIPIKIMIFINITISLKMFLGS